MRRTAFDPPPRVRRRPSGGASHPIHLYRCCQAGNIRQIACRSHAEEDEAGLTAYACRSRAEEDAADVVVTAVIDTA